MAMESFSFERVHAENPEEHERMLFEQIAAISLRFMRNVRKREEGDKAPLSEDVKRLTPITNIAFQPFWKGGALGEEGQEAIKRLEEDLAGEIDTLDPETYHDEDILSIAADVGREAEREVAEIKDLMSQEEMDAGYRRHRREGLIEWEPPVSVGEGRDGRFNALKNHGFSGADIVTEMHIRPAFSEKDHQKFSAAEIKKAFRKVAEDIVDRAPATKAIVGVSWLMDTAFAQRLGFTTVPEAEMSLNDFSTWYQFINADGQVHEERYRRFMETGVLPHRNTLGYMMTEDFLRRYLSAERKRNPIVLEDVNEDVYERVRILKEKSIQFSKEWDEIVERDGSVDADHFLAEYPDLQAAKEFYSEADWNIFMNFLREMGREGVRQEAFRAHIPEELIEAIQRYERNIHQKMFRKRRIDLSEPDEGGRS